MKTKLIFLLTSAFTLSVATAEPLTPDEIFAAIDGESELAENITPPNSVTPRINFDMSKKEHASSAGHYRHNSSMSRIEDDMEDDFYSNDYDIDDD